MSDTNPSTAATAAAPVDTSASSGQPPLASDTLNPSTTTAASHSSSLPSASSSLLDEPADDDDFYADSLNTHVAGARPPHRKSKSSSAVTSSSSSSSSASTPPNALLRGLSMTAVKMQSSLSKSLSVALQYTREKIGRADATTEEEPFLSTVAAVHALQAQLKASEKALAALVTAQQTSILAHDALSLSLKRHHSAALSSTTPRNAPPQRRDSTGPSPAADAIASIEAMTSAFAETSKQTDEPGSINEEKDEEKPAVEAAAEPSSSQTLSAAPAVNLLPTFYPYNRRLLSGRLTVSDAYGSLLASVRLLQSTTLKAALAAISQLEIDRLHYDACQQHLRTLTTPDPSATTAAPTSLEFEQWTLKVDQAQLVYLRAKATTEERAVELVQRVSEEMQRALTAIVAVEKFEWEAGVELLQAQAEGRELAGRKQTNPWSPRKDSQFGDANDDDATGQTLKKEVDALR